MRSICLIIMQLLLTGLYTVTYGYNIRHINSRDGLSNSAVICLLQDSDRHLWIGTYDGLNKYDGTSISIYKPHIDDKYSIAGNVIRAIIESDREHLWIVTKSGLDKYSRGKEKVVAHFGEFKEDCLVASDHQGNVLLVTQTGSLHYYDAKQNRFIEVDLPNKERCDRCKSFIIDSENRLWITTSDGIIKRFAIHWTDEGPRFTATDNSVNQEPVIYTFYDKGRLIIVDQKGDLFMVRSEKKTWIRNISLELSQYGHITSIIFDGDDILIGFSINGLIKLNRGNSYETEKIPVNCGVFSLLKDDVQDVIWVGTDGQGVYTCLKDGHIFKGINLEELSVNKQSPVRAICTDHNNDLWLGTKGSGLFRIKDYGNDKSHHADRKQFTHNDGLSNNSIFALKFSPKNNVLWIGSEGPHLDYYSYDDHRIHHLESNQFPPAFYGVHALLETSDSVLWIAASHNLLKVNVRKHGSQMRIRHIRKYKFDLERNSTVRFNQIFSICQENDSIMWLGIRGDGAIRFNFIKESYKVVSFNRNGMDPMNDILSICIGENGSRWFGSSYGLNSVEEKPEGGFDYQNFNESDGLSNNSIHGILETDDGKLWLSTNSGITLFDPADTTFRSFNHKDGLKVIEFSDNAYYKDKQRSRYFFGGIDGVVWIEQDKETSKHFVPPVSFTKLRLFNEEFPIHDFIVNKDGHNYLSLNHKQNFFAITFIANDYINGMNGKYSYQLDNFSDVWMEATSCEARFTNIPPGHYVLRVRYSNGTGENDQQIANLNIRIYPPWYLTLGAKISYVLIILAAAVLAYIYVISRYERKKKKMQQLLDQKYKEEMYESKLRFLTNVTHEFCTPLTLIYIPCERILNYEGSDSFVRKYAATIKSNAEKLNNLIQEIIDYRRMETGNKTCKIESCNINTVCTEIIQSFANLAEENHINFSFNIVSPIIWNTDRNCLETILNNLISNAFKYTPANGSIHVTISIEEEKLVLKVHNTGKGIIPEDIPRIFNRYSVLDNVEINSIKGLSSRNGLGLSICKSMVDLLEGDITVESEPGKYAEFIVRLPALGLSEDETGMEMSAENSLSPAQSSDYKKNNEPVRSNSSSDNIAPTTPDKPNLLIIDDNDTILALLKEILSDDYNILMANNGQEGLDKLTKMAPDIIITDIMMPDIDGISLTRKIKSNPHTMHIPLVILSAKSAIDDKISGIESGADAYISKPFDMQYLKTTVKQLIDKKKRLEKYYNSSISTYDYYNGQLLTRENRMFFEAVVDTIEKNINNIEFSPEDLADNLRVSMRTLYRKFKELELLPPKDFIKEQRITQAAKLILKTDLTIQEVMYRVGFTTRSHFYKEFTKRYNQSPKEYREQHGNKTTE